MNASYDRAAPQGSIYRRDIELARLGHIERDRRTLGPQHNPVVFEIDSSGFKHAAQQLYRVVGEFA